jgi:Na+-translocating ferredoxin:NAD+ oxidoreductase RnfD subunit
LRPALLAFAALIALTLLWPAIDSTIAAMPARSDAPNGQALFVDATSWSGLTASEHSCPRDGDRQYFVTGQAWGDADGDGITDLYLTNQCGPSTLYRGVGSGQFQRSPVTDQVALGGRQAGGAVFADVDGDGWADLLVLTYDGPVLFHNDNGRGFVDVTAAAGLHAVDGAHPVSATLADYDGDGALDIFIANYGCVRCLPGPIDEVRSQLFHNRGDARFVDVSSVLGGDGPMGFSFVAAWGDFDNDGDPDLYVTNDVRGGRSLHGNALYRNDGPGCGGWCFADVSGATGAGVRADAMGVAVADFNGDGALDIFVTNSGWAYTALTGPSLLLANQGDGSFHDVAPASGAAVDAMGWGAAALDADNDGWADLYVALGTDPASQGPWATTNRLLLNAGQGRFKDVTAGSGAADAADSFGVAVGDANGDGQADIVVGDYNVGYRLFLGTGGGPMPGHRLVVRLTGAGPVNRDAVGARIEAVLSDGRQLVHEVSLGGTLGGNDDPAFRSGTGKATVSRLTVRWPDGHNQVINDVPVDSEVHWTYAAEPEIRPLPVIAAYAELRDGTRISTLAMPGPMVGGLACVAIVALWLARRRRLQVLGYSVGTPTAGGPSSAGPGLPRAPRSLRLPGHTYPVVLPSPRDPRLHLAVVITSLQILGQAVLGFELSIAQILVSVLTCGVIELTITFRRTRSIVWPASALLTGNGVAFILRVPGTQHGDWWSMQGWYLYAGVAAVSVLSKYLIRDKGRHVFNPSNFGLVLAFLLLGSSRIEPLDFSWGPISPGVAAAFAIIVVGALIVLSRLRLLEMASAFWVTFAAGMAVIAAAGHCMSARWSFEPVCGASFWRAVVMSPELFVFMFFMMTDPKTTPEGRVARIIFGAAVGFAAALFVAPQQTEFATKVALLASLTVLCAVRPCAERFFPAARSERDTVRAWLAGLVSRRAQPQGAPSWGKTATHGGVALVVVSVCLASLVALGVPARLPVAGLRAADALVSRPAIAIDPSTLPPVTLDSSIRRLDTGVTEGNASAMARDVAADLQIEALAVQKADRELAKTAAAGARLDGLLRDIDASRESGRITVSTYTFASMTLVPVYDTDNVQAGPRYGFEVRGTVHRVTYEGSNSARPARQEDVPYERTFALLPRNGTFLIAADYPLARP